MVNRDGPSQSYVRPNDRTRNLDNLYNLDNNNEQSAPAKDKARGDMAHGTIHNPTIKLIHCRGPAAATPPRLVKLPHLHMRVPAR